MTYQCHHYTTPRWDASLSQVTPFPSPLSTFKDCPDNGDHQSESNLHALCVTNTEQFCVTPTHINLKCNNIDFLFLVSIQCQCQTLTGERHPGFVHIFVCKIQGFLCTFPKPLFSFSRLKGLVKSHSRKHDL